MGTRFEWFSRSGYDRATGKWDRPVPEGVIEVHDDGSLRVMPDDDYYTGEMSSEVVQAFVREIFGKLPREAAKALMLKLAADMLDKSPSETRTTPEAEDGAVDDLLLPLEALARKSATALVASEQQRNHLAGVVLEVMSCGIVAGKALTDAVAIVLAAALMRRARVLTGGVEYFK